MHPCGSRTGAALVVCLEERGGGGDDARATYSCLFVVLEPTLRLPARALLGPQDGAASETTAEELFKGRNVVVFGLPGEAAGLSSCGRGAVAVRIGSVTR